MLKQKHFNRFIPILCVAVLAVAGIMPMLVAETAYAYGQVTSRSIQMSDSVGGDTGVTYLTTFHVATTGAVQGIVVDFCSSDPIISDACTLPSGFTVGGSPTFSGLSGVTSPGSWSAASANSGRTFELTYGSGGSVSSGATITFAITNVHNPTATNASFYARIFTFATSGAVATWASTTDGSSTTGVVDAGGIALTTNQSVIVTSKVQEQISFCIGTNAVGSGLGPTPQTLCASLSGTNVTLGDTNGVLSSTGPYVDVTTQYIVGTNATGGAIINMKGPTLTSGSNTIAAIGGTATASAAGTSQFGLCNYEGTGSNLVFTGYNAYNSAGCSGTTQTAGFGSTGGNGTASFGFNTTNTTSTYGDTIAKENSGSNSTGIIALIGNIASSQVAGIYSTTLNFIATGTY